MRNAIGILFIVLLALIAPFLLLASSIHSGVLTPSFLKRELSRHNLYALASSQMDQQIQRLAIDPAYPITREELTTLAHEILTDAWLQQNVETVIESFFVWLRAPSDAPLSLPIDLREPKRQIGQRVDALLAAKLPLIEPCPKRGQAEGICTFAGMSVEQVKEELAHAGFDVAALLAAVPDTLDIINPDLSMIVGPPNPNNANDVTNKSAEILSKLALVKDAYQRASRYLLDAWIGYGVFVLGYLALNATNGWRRLVRWAGILAVSTSVLPVGMAIAADVLVEQQLLPQIHLNASLPIELQRLVPNLITDLQQALFVAILLVGATWMFLGVGMIIDAQFLPRRAAVKK